MFIFYRSMITKMASRGYQPKHHHSNEYLVFTLNALCFVSSIFTKARAAIEVTIALGAPLLAIPTLLIY
jgi:hypothetical protein